MIATTRLLHGRCELALHTLREGSGHPLLLLHGLGERTPDLPPPPSAGWAGPVLGLDFVGHGESTIPVGGGYTAEILMADVDTALRHLGEATVLGRGLGAYIALLVAGARADLVHGAILADGPGLAGGGIRPGSPHVLAGPATCADPPDPFALAELSGDVRPPDYAATWVRHANEYGFLDNPVAVATVVRPEWVEGILAEPGVIECSLSDALNMYSA